jgi:hypothetical protein
MTPEHLQDEIVELAVWYIDQTASEAALRALADEITFLKTAVPLRASAVEVLKRHYVRKQKNLRARAA